MWGDDALAAVQPSCRWWLTPNLPGENVPVKSNTIPGRLKSVQFQPGTVFTFIPEWCSESARNTVQLHRGIVFSFARIPQLSASDFCRLSTRPWTLGRCW